MCRGNTDPSLLSVSTDVARYVTHITSIEPSPLCDKHHEQGKDWKGMILRSINES